MNKIDPVVSVVTATFNSEKTLPRLIKSLKDQTCKDFKWVVADGGSKDGTLDLLAEASSVLPIDVSSGPDFGIYDALNNALARVDTPYYLTMGSDDWLFSNAIGDYSRAAAVSGADIVSACVKKSDGGMLVPNAGHRRKNGHLAYVSQHAVGALIKRSLHDRVGMYSRHYPVAADRYFLLKAIEHQGCSLCFESFQAGVYAIDGTSGVRLFDTYLDVYKVDYALSSHPKWTAFYSWLRYGAGLRHF